MNNLVFRNLSDDLNGSKGVNRIFSVYNQINANCDIDALDAFIRRYMRNGSETATSRAYRKECYRLLLWAVEKKLKPLSSLNGQDAEDYSTFLTNPDPDWCGQQNRAIGSEWKPFHGPLGNTSHRTAITILKSMMSFLKDVGYIGSNPFTVPRVERFLKKRVLKDEIEKRCLSNQQWSVLTTFLDTQKCFKYRRAKFLISLMFFLNLRVDEVNKHTMGHFSCVRSCWRFLVLGKGNKQAWVPVNDDMLAILQEYRVYLGLPALPEETETIPLMCSQRMQSGITVRRMAQIVDEVMMEASALLENNPAEAQKMLDASPHWFRHTGISRQVEAGLTLAQVKENARHASIATTGLYIHAEDDERHRMTQRVKWKA